MSARRVPTRIPPRFEITKSPNFKVIFASGVFGGLNPNDGQMIFYLDRFEPEMVSDQPGRVRLTKINREFQVELHMTPSQFKSISQWMARHVQTYEQKFGEIPLGPRQDDEGNPLVQ
jgi:hypothetical protein